ncbi:unnamed protein product [Penicillium nalgiovense]|nr:unnamed protein product [Penicillium nalgiovense]
METEESKGLAVPHVTSPIIESTPTSPEKIEALSVPLPVSPVIEPISLSQLNPGLLEEPSKQTETSDAQVGNVALHQQFPDTVMKEALKALIDNSISVVEYGNQVLYRCGYAEVLISVEWIVPDEQLLLASQVLLKHNWPRLLYHERDWTGYPKIDEYWESQYLMHDLDGQGWMRVHLMPMSLVGFTLEETVEAPSTFAHELHLRTPKPPHYMSSLIRHLLQLPIEHDSRLRVEKDLMAFISAYILKDGPADTTMWTHLDDQESDEDLPEKS